MVRKPPDTGLIGRNRELADLHAVVGAAATRPVSLLLLGDAGIGKTALLGAVAAHAAGRGLRVFSSTAASTEPFALLRALLAPCRADLDGAPESLRWMLDGRPVEAAREPALLTAMLLAVDRLTADEPALLLVDDAHRADPESLRLLTLLMRNTSAERFGLVLAARSSPGAAIGADIPRYELGPLTEQAAARLLDAQPGGAHGRPRAEILRRSAGNPLALITFADPAGRVPAEFGARLDGLGEPARRLLLHAALAGDREDVATVSRAAGGRADLRDWQQAEEAGLISVVDGRVRFGHPLVRAACAAGSRAGVEGAHLNLARLTADPHQRARHLAAATTGAYESVAAGLEDTAGSPGRYVEEARALQDAAERSTDPADAARRYARAVFAANRAGDPAWAVELYEQVAARTDDPDVLGAAACGAGLAFLHAAQATRAFELTRQAVRRRPRDGQVAMTAVAVAATAALLSGVAGQRAQLSALLDLVDERHGGELGEAMVPRAANPAARASVLAIADPAGPTRPPEPPGTAMTAMAELAWMLFTGTVAWLRDDSGRAVAELHTAWQAEQRSGAPGSVLNRLPLLITAMIDGGKWAEADQVLDEAERLAAVGDVALLRAVCPALRAVLRAQRQDGPAPAITLATLADPAGGALVESLRQRAAGMAALAAGDYETGYRCFRAMFDAAGEPVHYFIGPRSLPQLALAAARTGRTAQACRILTGCRDRAGSAPTPRMALLLAHAAALLDDSDGAEQHFRRAIDEPDRALRWPLEYAEAQLNYGLWLRGRRRLLEARPHLLAALDTFQRLGARGHAEQARRNLPAGGLTATNAPPPADAFAGLTAQKQMIARLAATGLTNREIADRLFVSPRTVGSHLYDIYPLLGIGNRHQLRELVAGQAARAETRS